MAAQPELKTGDSLAGGRFRIDAELGQGSIGRVFLVQEFAGDGITQRGRFAAKTLNISRPEYLLTLKNEFRALADVSHPNLVQFYELYATDSPFFLTMEYVDGRQLHHWLWGSRAFPGYSEKLNDAIINILPQWLAAITALHGAHLIHRDIKPANILVDRNERLVMLDFGLATDAYLEETLTAGVGTPRFWAPEQLRGRAVRASDWYSVGASLYHLLTGMMPPGLIEDDWGFLDVAPDEWRPPLRALLEPEFNLRGDGDVFQEVFSAPGRRAVQVPASQPTHFAGRQDEVRTIQQTLSATRGARVLHVIGESGIGKSELIRHALGHLDEDGEDALLLAARCRLTESVRQRALDPVIDELARYLSRLPADEGLLLVPRFAGSLLKAFPILSSVPALERAASREPPPEEGAPPVAERARAALRELLLKLSDRRVLVIWIDDAQWGDVDSLDPLREIMHSPDSPRLLLLLSYRPGESAFVEGVHSLESDLDVPSDLLEIESLDEVHSETLVRRILLDDSLQIAPALLREAGGSPFLLSEIARFKAQTGELPERLTDSLQRRYDDLDDPERSIVTAAAAIGHPMTQAHLLSLGDSDAAELVLRLLKSAWLRRADGAGDTFEPYHDRVREFVLRSTAAEQLRSLHAAMAELLEADDDAPRERLVEHLSAAGLDWRAVKYAIAAAEEAMEQFAYDRAAEHYALARAASTEDSALLIERQARALSEAGRSAEAAEVMSEAFNYPELRKNELANRIFVAQEWIRAARQEEAQRALKAIGEFYDVKIPDGTKPAIVSTMLQRASIIVRSLLRDYSRVDREAAPRAAHVIPLLRLSESASASATATGDWLATYATLLALKHGDAEMVRQTMLREACAQAGLGTPLFGLSRRSLKRMVDLTRRIRPAEDGMGYTCFNVGGVHYFHAEYRRALLWFLKAEKRFLKAGTGPRSFANITDSYICYAATWTGHYDLIRDKTIANEKDARLKSDMWSLSRRISHEGTIMRLAADEPAEALRHLRSLDTTMQEGNLLFFAPSLWRTHMYLNDFAAAHTHEEYAWPIIRTRSFDMLDSLGRILRFSRATVQLGSLHRGIAADRDAVLTAVQENRKVISKTRLKFGAPFLKCIDASLEGLEGNQPGAANLLRRVIPEFHEAEMPLLAHLAACKLGGMVDAAPTDRAQRDSALTWLSERQIRNADAMARAFLPET